MNNRSLVRWGGLWQPSETGRLYPFATHADWLLSTRDEVVERLDLSAKPLLRLRTTQ
jgi:hypothetical protein